MSYKHYHLRYLLFAQLLASIALGQAQQVVVLDWSKRPTAAGSSVPLQVSSPTSGEQSVNFQITNTNNILYQYTMSCQLRSDTSASTDFSQLIGILVGGKVEGSNDDQSAQQVLDAISDYLSQKSCATANSCSGVALKDTLDKLNSYLGPADQPSVTTLNGLIAKDKQTAGGSLSENARKNVVAAVAHVQSLISATHSVSFTEAIDPTKAYSCTVSEYLNQPQNGQLLSTKDGTMSISVGQAKNVVSLSIGPLFSAIQNRTYSSVMAPNGSAGSSTVLQVQGKSPSTSIVSLANFAVPIPSRWRKLESDKFGVAIAAGPAVRVNSSSGTSVAGFFGGISVYLWKQLFITPGFHVGQFADYPPGFSAPGQTVPANLSTPQPTIRTTVRFGVSLSYLVKDFSALKQTGTATTTAAGGAKPATPTSGNTGASGAGQQGGASTSGLTVAPNPVDFGSASSVTVTISNTSGKVAQLTWKIPEAPTHVDFSDGTAKCQSIAVGATCSFQLSLTRPATPTTTTLQIGILGGKPLDVPVKWQ